MATYNVRRAKHATLSAGVADTVNFSDTGLATRVRNNHASGILYFTIDGQTTPSGADDDYVVYPSENVVIHVPGIPTVKLFSSAAVNYSVERVAKEINTSVGGSGGGGGGGAVTTDFQYDEDSAHVSTDTGAFVLGVRNDTGTTLTSANGDYSPIAVSDKGAVLQSSSTKLISGTRTSNGVIFSEDLLGYESVYLQVESTGAVHGGIRLEGSNNNTDWAEHPVQGIDFIGLSDVFIETDGTVLGPLRARYLRGTVEGYTSGTVSVVGYASSGPAESLYVQLAGSGNSVTTPYTKPEDTAHISGADGAFILGVRNSAGATLTSADGDYSPIAVTATGAVQVDSTKTEDAAHSSGTQGAFVLGVRNDAAATTFTSADGDYSPLATDAQGRVGVADLGGSISVDDNAGSLTVDNTVLSVTGGGTEATAQRVTIANDSTGVLSVDDNGGSLTVDGTVATNAEKVEDAGHASGDTGIFILGVRNDTATARTTTNTDYSPISTDSAGRVGIADLGGSISINDGGNVISVDDAAGSLTVDGTVSVSGAVDTELPAAAALADNTANPTVPATGAFLMGFDGTNWDRVRADGGSLFIQDGGNSITVDGTVTTNSEKTEDTAHSTGHVGQFILGVRNSAGATLTDTDGDYSPIAVESTGNLRVNVISAPTTAVTGTNFDIRNLDVAQDDVRVGGMAAIDATVADNPVLMGGRASTAQPADVSADGDAQALWVDQKGSPVVTQAPHVGLLGEPWNLVHKGAQYTTQQTSTVFQAGGASEKIVVTQIQIQAFGTTAFDLQVYFGTGAFVRGTNRTIFDGTFKPSTTLAPGYTSLGPFIAGTNGDDIMVTTSAAGSVTISVWYYIVT